MDKLPPIQCSNHSAGKIEASQIINKRIKPKLMNDVKQGGK